MTNKPDDTSDNTLESLDVEAGLEAAYEKKSKGGAGAPAAQVPSSADVSVLARLASDGGAYVPLLLREAGSTVTPTPVVRPGSGGDRGGTRRGRYRVVGEIARGGVGVVFKGHDVDLGRDVAMKVIRDEYADTPEVIQRFVEEAQIGGQLQHPGIVPVYEIGLGNDRRPFFTMKLIKGKTLAALLTARPSPSQGRRRALSIFESVCQTVGYAHSRGVIHRDLKPSNVMVGAYGEVLVVDWGMGKVLRHGGIEDERTARRRAHETVVSTLRSDGEGSQSVVGSVMGTPRYMSPEQARGDVERVDERSDVFGLGAILCEILTGQPPYTGDGSEVFGEAAAAKLDDAYARLDACGADQKLVAVARRCLTPAPDARYQSAGELAKAVGAYLAGVELRAEQAKLAATRAEERARASKKAEKAAHALARQEKQAAEYARRARRFAVSLAAVVVLVIGVGVFLGWRSQQRKAVEQARTALEVNQALERAKLFADQAEEKQELTLWARARTAIEEASRALAKGNADADLHDRFDATRDRIVPKAKMARLVLADLERSRKLAASDDLDGALQACRSAAKRMPEYAETYSRTARLLKAAGREPEAVEAFRQAIARRRTPSDMIHLALVQEDRAKARAAAERAIRAFPHAPEPHNVLSNYARDRAEKITTLRRALQMDPTFHPAVVNLKNLYLKAVQENDRRVLDGDLLPPEPRWRLYIAQVCTTLIPRYADSVRLYELAFQARPALESEMGGIRSHRMYATQCALNIVEGASPAEQKRLRNVSIGWIEAHAQAWTDRLAKGSLEDAEVVLKDVANFEIQLIRIRAYKKALGLNAEQYATIDAVVKSLEEWNRRAAEIIADRRAPGDVAAQVAALVGTHLLNHTKRDAESFAFFKAAFAPGQLDGVAFPLHSYNAACAALVKGERPRALRWIRMSLTGRKQELGRGGRVGLRAKRYLEWFAKDPGLAPVRGAALAKLPESEREDWQAFWEEWKTACK